MSSQVIPRNTGDAVLKGYLEYERTPHGRLRHDLLFKYFQDFMTRKKIGRICDVGGAAGLLIEKLTTSRPDLRWLLADDDETMLDAARKRLADRMGPQRGEVVRGGWKDVPRILADRRDFTPPFILSFNHVIEYVVEKDQALETLAAQVPRGSYLGMMYVNNTHEAMRKLWHKDSISGMLERLQSGAIESGTFGSPVSIMTPQVESTFKRAGLAQVEECGLRCVAEFKSREFVESHYAELLDAEYQIGREPDFMGLARYRLKFFTRP